MNINALAATIGIVLGVIFIPYLSGRIMKRYYGWGLDEPTWFIGLGGIAVILIALAAIIFSGFGIYNIYHYFAGILD